MKKIVLVSVLVNFLSAEYIFISPSNTLIKDSYIKGFYSNKEYFGFSIGFFDKFELFVEDKKVNSLYGAKVLLQKESKGFPSLSYTIVDESSSKAYITLGKTFSYMKYYLGYEKKEKNFYGGCSFAYSKDLSFSFQYNEDTKSSFWIDYNLYKFLNISVGKFDKRGIVWLSSKFDFSKNYIKEINTNTQNSDELENFFNSISFASKNLAVDIKTHGIYKKHIVIKQKEFNAYKNKRVSKNYTREALTIKRYYKPDNKLGYEFFIEPIYKMKVSRKNSTKDDFLGNIGGNVGGVLPLYLSYEAKVSKNDMDEKKLTINYIFNKENNFLRAELGRFEKKDGYDIEFIKTIASERFAIGASFQKQGELKANFLSLNYVPKISKTIGINLKIGKFFNEINAIDLSFKRFYKDATLGSNLFIQQDESDYKLKVYLILPINYKNISIIPTLKMQTFDYEQNYIDSKNSFENTIFDKNNITLQKELL